MNNVSKVFKNKKFLFGGQNNQIYAVDDVSIQLNEGDTLGLVGESGSGKTTLGKLLMKLIQPSSGEINISGYSFSNTDKNEYSKFRRKSRMIFQNLDAALNPKMRIDKILEEPLKIYSNLDAEDRKLKVSEIMERIRLPKYLLSEYPHSLSGGQKRRLSLGRAIAIPPSFLVADEPLSALDVSVRGQIIQLFKELQHELNITMIFISHDISVLPELCNKIGVMYKGKIIEELSIGDLQEKKFTKEYTQKLISSVLKLPEFN